MNPKSREWSLCVGWQTGRATQSDHSRKVWGRWGVRGEWDVRGEWGVRGQGLEGRG